MPARIGAGIKRLDQVEQAVACVDDELFSALDHSERLQLQHLLARVTAGFEMCEADVEAALRADARE